MRKAFIVLPLLLVLLITACKADLDEAEDEFCLALGNLGQSLAAVENLHSRSTVEETERALEDLDKARKDVREAAAQLADVRLDAVEGVLDSLQGEINNISGDTTLSGAKAQVLNAAEDARGAIDDIYSLTCR
jgi:hypothetical protein